MDPIGRVSEATRRIAARAAVAAAPLAEFPAFYPRLLRGQRRRRRLLLLQV